MRRSSFAFLTMLALAATLSGGSRARAQGNAELAAHTGIDLRLFRPAVDTKGHFMVNGTDILGANNYSFGLVLDAAGGILPFNGYEDNGALLAANASRYDRIVSTAFTGQLAFNFGIANWLVVGATLPVTMLRGPAIQVPGIYNDGPTIYGLQSQGVGDLGLNLKLRILRSDRHPIGLAVIARGTFPTGNSRAMTGDLGASLWPSVVVEYRHRVVRVSGELGYRHAFGPLHPAAFPVTGRTIPSDPGGSATQAMLTEPGRAINSSSLLTFGAGASFHLGRAADLVVETYGTEALASRGQEGSFSLEALGGLKFFINGPNYLMVGGGAGIPIDHGFQQANWRGMLGIVFEPSVADRDHDGLRDDIDQCPDDPEDRDDFEDTDGCPDPDNDRDGILDVDDQCVDVPEDRDNNEDEDGCPEGGDFDRDRDGILDQNDACPDDPEDMDNFEDTDGCPDPDNDRDGLNDDVDQCPNDPEDYDGFQDDDGCPDPDNDQDRILDDVDRCPDEPETYNGSEDEDGCPDRGLVVLEENQLVILEKIYFETNSAVIMRRSLPVIEAVAATLQGNPQIRLLEVQGHADERGNDDHNLRLTRDRAASVVEALVQRGVDRNRLQSAGYGELCPIQTGHNAAAWDQNRRVEFTIIENEFGPTGVLGGCDAAAHLRPRPRTPAPTP